MLCTILDNIIIIILTLANLPTCKSPELLIIIAGILMIFTDYEAFNEEKSKGFTLIHMIMMTFFAVLSGGFAGFAVFFLLKQIREYIRIMLGVSLYAAAALVIYRDMLFAMLIVRMFILTAMFIVMMLINRLIFHLENKKLRDSERLTAANVSEMHEKRLNEQLTVQNFLAEKNARLLERENISRNIHNSVGHSITAAIMALDSADVLYDAKPEEARKRMNDANSRIRGSLELIRRAVRVLDEENRTLPAYDIKCEMETIINGFMIDADIHVDWDFGWLADDMKIMHDHAVFLVGALQELLTNGVKHGHANDFFVFLLGDTAHIRLEVSDNGKSDFNESNGKTKIENGFGIKKIISYVEKCGGKCEFTNDNGFRCMIELSCKTQNS